MSEVLGRVSNAPTLFQFWCEGCGYCHHLETGPAGWKWNGDLVKPTASPSLLVNKDRVGNSPRCHFFIRAGELHYCGDCDHELAGQVVPMTPWADVDR